MGESVSRLSVEIDGRPAVVSLEQIATAADGADKAVRGLTAAAKEDTSSRVAQIIRNTEYVEALKKQGLSAAQARAELRLLIAAEKDEADALREVAAASRATGDALASEGDVGIVGGAKKASFHIGSLGRTMTSFIDQVTGAPPVIGHLAYALGTFGFGAVTTVAVLGGLAAISLGLQSLGSDFLKTEKTANEAAKAFRSALDARKNALTLNNEQVNATASSLGVAQGLANATAGLGALGLGGISQFFRNRARTRSEELASSAVAGADAQDEAIRRRVDLLAKARELDPTNAGVARQAREAAAGYREQAAALGILNPKAQEFLEFSKSLLAQDEKDSKANARGESKAERAAKRAAEAAQRLAEKIARERPRETAAGFGEISNIESRNGTALLGALTQALGDTSRADAANAPLRGLTGTPKGGLQAALNKSLLSAGGAEQLARLEGFQQLRTNLADALGKTLEGGIAAGFETFFKTGSLGDGFKALAGGLLNGLGDAAISFGVGAIGLSKLMIAIKKSIQSLNPEIALPAGIALVALGGTLKGLASKLFSGGGGGGTSGAGGGYGGGGYTGAPDIIDRGVIAGALPSASIPSAASVGALGTPTQPVIVNANIIGTADPRAQRDITDLIRGAVSRGLTAPGFSPATA